MIDNAPKLVGVRQDSSLRTSMIAILRIDRYRKRTICADSVQILMVTAGVSQG
jgi:hypothetical protein